MIIVDQLEFGHKIYCVTERNNAFAKKKIKTVIDGVEWFRYDRDHWEYFIEEIVYCGRVTYVEEGEVRFNEDRQVELHFKYPNGQIWFEHYNDVEEYEDWFHTRAEAENHIEQMKLKRNNE